MTYSEDCLNSINGHLLSYYIVCPRQAWFSHRGINQEWTSEIVDLGKALDEIKSKNRKMAHIQLSRSEIDLIKRKDGKIEVYEIKKSSKLEMAHRAQLMFYLFILHKLGVDSIGVLWYPTERKKVVVYLNPIWMEELINKVCKVISSDKPPQAKRKPYCAKCSYYEYCWV